MTTPPSPTGPPGASPSVAAAMAAALQEFSTYGFRRSSMEGIARRAHLSRATLYTHWRSKDELFRALVTQLHEDQQHAMSEAAEALADRPFQERLVAVLEARFLRWVELTSASDHAVELYDVHGRQCGDIARASQARSEELLTDLVADAVRTGELDLVASGLSAAEAAAALFDAGHGAKGEDPAAATPEEFRRRLRRIVALVTHGLGARPATGPAR